jgi:hypothetical protein
VGSNPAAPTIFQQKLIHSGGPHVDCGDIRHLVIDKPTALHNTVTNVAPDKEPPAWRIPVRNQVAARAGNVRHLFSMEVGEELARHAGRIGYGA